MTADGDARLLVHAAAVEAGMPVDLDLDRPLAADRDAVGAHRMQDAKRPLVALLAKIVQALVEGAHAAVAQVDLDHQARPQL